MVYQGSKTAIASDIAGIIAQLRKPEQVYWEPFVGSASVFELIPGFKIGTDAMTDLILLWNEMISNTFVEPSSLTKEEYDKLMKSEEPSALRAYAGFFWSFSCMFKKGYAPEEYARSRSFYSMHERAQRLAKQVDQGLIMKACDYRIPMLDNAVIYCDPPYANTTGYRGVDPFNHDDFYAWCIRENARGNKLIISEYEMPKPFFCIHEFTFSTKLQTVHRGRETSERLFTL